MKKSLGVNLMVFLLSWQANVSFSNRVGLQLGSKCSKDYQCLDHVQGSQCIRNVCSCQSHHVVYNSTACLPSSLLGVSCQEDIQCKVNVENSYCDQNSRLCQCHDGYLSFRRRVCLKGALNNKICLNNQHCQKASQYSYCKYILPKIYGKCRCYKGYVAKNDICVPLLGSLCRDNNECQAWSKNTYCRKGDRISHCSCKPGFTMSYNRLQCILKSRNRLNGRSDLEPASLGKPCIHNVQCKMVDPHSICVDWTCECQKKSSTCNLNNTGCYRDTFQCNSGQCISWYFVCDGIKHCRDGSDETLCIANLCPAMAFQCANGQCKSRKVLCNGVQDCDDGSDEANCTTSLTAQRTCDQRSFKCANGQCIPAYGFCNAIADCADKSDEQSAHCVKGEECPVTSFKCNNGRCRSTSILCSGADGCGDNSDETNCRVCTCPRPHV